MAYNFESESEMDIEMKNETENETENEMDTFNSEKVSRLLYPELSYEIIGAIIEVHRRLGPGQLESTYERALAIELELAKTPFRRQVPIESFYRGELIGEFVADFVVDDKVILELKSVESLRDVHRAQLLSYLRASNLRLGLLINFNVSMVSKHVIRVVN